MPSLESELKTYLLTKSAITDLVGSGSSARIFEDRPRQNRDTPFVVITTFDGVSTEHIGGISGLARNRVQIDCHGATSAEAYTLAEAVRLAPLQMFRGTMGSTYVNSVTSEFGYRKFSYEKAKGSDTQVFVRSRDYIVFYQEATSV